MQNSLLIIYVCVVSVNYAENRLDTGKPVLTGQFPWQVSLQEYVYKMNTYGWWHFCGAAILTHEWIVSAAHCNIETDVKAVVGTTLWNVYPSTHDVISKVVHPQGYDIMLMKVQPPFKFNRFINTICLPETDEEFIGTATSAGWGSIGSQSGFSDRLRAVNMSLMSDEHCVKSNTEKFRSDVNLCAANTDYNGICYADSGSGVFAEARDKAILVGIVSKLNENIECASYNNPDLYLNMAFFVSWIKQTIAEDKVNQILQKTPIDLKIKTKFRSLNLAKVHTKYPC